MNNDNSKNVYSAFFNAMKNKDLPTPAKILLGTTLAYIISPVDLLPEIVTGPLGYLDDVGVAALLIGIAGKIIMNRMKNGDNGNSGSFRNENNSGNPNPGSDTVDSHFRN